MFVVILFVVSGKKSNSQKDNNSTKSSTQAVAEATTQAATEETQATTAATTQATVATTAATQSQNTTTAAMDNTFIFSDSNSRKLTKEEVLRLSAWDTKLAKNEIYARHNRKFDNQKIQAYFDSQQWYHGTVAPSDFDEDVFNEYEKANVELLKKAEDGTLTASTSSGTSSTDDGYIISDSSIRELTDSDLSGLSKSKLRIARNEIYARHHRKFDSADLQIYFDKKSWYSGTIEPSDFDEKNELSQIEQIRGKNMRKRFSLCKKVGVFLLTAVMCTSQLNVQAEKKYDFETEYQVVTGANGYFIAKNQQGEYGLLDREGEKAVGFDYSEMEFPKDTMQYQYIKVKQNKNWGIVDYDENTLVPLNFEKVSEYSNGNTIAAGYNGNTTYLYDLKGKQQKKQLTGSGSYSVISDTVFWGKEDIRNEKDNTLVKLEENSLLDKKKNSLAVKVGDTHYAVQKYTTQLTGNLETDQNIEVYEKDEKTQDILPEEEWVKDKDSTVKGSLKLIKAVSDKNIIADMQMDDGFRVIYNIEDGQSTSKYKSIGEFRDGKAFAVDMDNNIKIIDTSGKAINKNDIEVADCG